MPLLAQAVQPTALQPATATPFLQTLAIPTEELCSSTVAYTFVTKDSLPLWPVWKSYFDGCPSGSFTVLVHTQTPGAAAADVGSVGGEELSANHTVQGDLHHNWGMIDAMLNLYEGVEQRGRAGNGCVPRWVHMSSAADAPVQTCLGVHNHLRLSTGRSFVQHYEDDGVWKRCADHHT